MHRRLIILSFVMVLSPGLAVAGPKSPEVPLWKRVLSVLTPAPGPTPTRHDQSKPAKVVAPSTISEPPRGLPDRSPPTKSTGTDSACNGGRRVMSAYYWEGRQTASGQAFNPQGMTAAHRTLPFGTRLTVTNPRTGKSVNVIVNDRGPFVSGVSLDLSLGAAQAIGMHGTGAVCIS
jgi:rare lipoprotein A (peptidoglycan hydrolase)